MCNRVMGIPEGEERKKKIEIFEAIMAEKCPKSMTTIKPQMQEAQRITGSTNASKCKYALIQKHIVLKLQRIKDKKKILKEARGGKKNTHFTYRGRKIRITLDFSSETTQARRE